MKKDRLWSLRRAISDCLDTTGHYKLASIFFFLAQYDNEIAMQAVQKIREAASSLEPFPKKGRPEGQKGEYKELIIPFGSSGYILLYEVFADKVLVHSVKHQKELDY